MLQPKVSALDAVIALSLSSALLCEVAGAPVFNSSEGLELLFTN